MAYGEGSRSEITDSVYAGSTISDPLKESIFANDSGVDLCLPAAIVTEAVLTSAPLPIQNTHWFFSSITWYQLKSPRPPNQ
ncbi:hypothetical protein [Motiliproteus sp. MSK22-1]|uniref:hypothetical protein n=1 Tax=Motiliproteus sp. MSK22-1 TaxID=1897630 RepID=UPI00117EFE02|nr:hypothetical protein [Motiliproteus sp. MSK22-1]